MSFTIPVIYAQILDLEPAPVYSETVKAIPLPRAHGPACQEPLRLARHRVVARSPDRKLQLLHIPGWLVVVQCVYIAPISFSRALDCREASALSAACGRTTIPFIYRLSIVCGPVASAFPGVVAWAANAKF